MRAAFNEFVVRHEVAWELTMGVLAIAYLIAGFAAEGSDAAAMVIVEGVLTAVFMAEFATRLLASLNRSAYVRGHWIDLVALIPVMRQFRILRLLRLLRLVRTFAGLHRALLHVEQILGNRQIATVAVIWLAILVLTSFGMYVAENGVNETITSPLDALWWGITTMTTVGYGDVIPVTPEGKLAAGVLMVLGIGLFGIVTATVTGLLIRPDEQPASAVDPVDQIGRLFGLVSSGALTHDEFTMKKAELLERV
jgi:voltage-gated potassium channel